MQQHSTYHIYYLFLSVVHYRQLDLNAIVQQNQYQMYKGHPFANKVLQKIEQEKLQQTHLNNILRVRPSTGMAGNRDNYVTLNPKKRQMQNQTKCTEIERENRLLLNKITNIMNKRRGSSENKNNNGSLNSTIRRRQFESIEIENAKMLKRLQERKSDYELHRFKKQWKKTKAVIKNITSYPIIDQIIGKKKRKNTVYDMNDVKRMALTNPEEFQIVKVKLINAKKFLVTLKFTSNKFVIIGDLRADKQLKVIQIDKAQALEFIEEQCEGNIHNVFDLLRFNQNEGCLYIALPQGQQIQACKDKEGVQVKEKAVGLRRKRQASHKPLYQQENYLTLNKEDLAF